MTNDRPLEVTEMAVRVFLQAVWFGSLAGALAWWCWPSLLWALAGFPSLRQPEPITLLLHGIAALIAAAWGLRVAALLFFQVLPFLVAKALQPRPPNLKRNN